MTYGFRGPEPGVITPKEYSITQGALEPRPVPDISSIEDFWEILDSPGSELMVNADFWLVKTRSSRILQPNKGHPLTGR